MRTESVSQTKSELPCAAMLSPQRLCQIAAYAVLITCMGCGGNPHGTIRVVGKVTVDDQAPPGPGKIMFTPTEPAGGFPRRPGIATFGVDGYYEVQSWDPGDGLVPGHYQASVECWETPPNLDGKPFKSYIAAKHQSPTTSGLEIMIEVKSKSVEFDIPVTSN